jgi:hypothetical protein
MLIRPFAPSPLRRFERVQDVGAEQITGDAPAPAIHDVQRLVEPTLQAQPEDVEGQDQRGQRRSRQPGGEGMDSAEGGDRPRQVVAITERQLLTREAEASPRAIIPPPVQR